jgi:hypothetical protein
MQDVHESRTLNPLCQPIRPQRPRSSDGRQVEAEEGEDLRTLLIMGQEAYELLQAYGEYSTAPVPPV